MVKINVKLLVYIKCFYIFVIIKENKDIYVKIARDILMPLVVVILLMKRMNCWKTKKLKYFMSISSQVKGTPLKGSTTT